MKISEIMESENGSKKYLLSASDSDLRKSVESTFFIHTNQHLPYLCISSQYGCAVGCVFCETGRQQPLGNMTTEQIVQQVLLCHEHLLHSEALGDSQRLNTILFAGMGEPMLNLKEISGAIAEFKKQTLADRVTLTTVGIRHAGDKIYDLPLDMISISLHATTDEQRNMLIPSKAKFGIKDLLDHFSAYHHHKNVPVIVNYLMLEGINDSQEDLARLKDLVDKDTFIIKLKYLNEVSDINGITLNPSEKMQSFAKALTEAGFRCISDISDGTEILGGCGQLKSQVRDIRSKYRIM
ncbi:radical SAM protein [Xenorhabdus doucetiae]|uniref:23S rRNA (Adenine2503-C2)-methyltransferase n=1 Tax=Xenorhabdus doucetiae TaxID=351671 RepID=A0A068QVF2_9GAMM|nr:radical SAM protein [Xenorhabdus doucetiae]TYP03605.1 23S rRNA (adenine2503-C2)-methyltransferase [Xenorhabdus doucetiae]CDG17835.1 putative Ribosomal RNA large subunit methyltransferase N [Xenorhabdus doucetiae]